MAAHTTVHGVVRALGQVDVPAREVEAGEPVIEEELQPPTRRFAP